nr:large ribosomal subunit protein bL27m-like [Nerophis lumbriciformis]
MSIALTRCVYESKMASLVHWVRKYKAGIGLSNPGLSFILSSQRFASKKAGGSSKNHGGNSPGKRYGLKKKNGNLVHAGNILATQRLLRYHPGANVGMGTNNTVYALEDGYVRLTKEVYIPPPRSMEASQIITKLAKGALLYKTFINIVPVKQEPIFKLVSMIAKPDMNVIFGIKTL